MKAILHGSNCHEKREIGELLEMRKSGAFSSLKGQRPLLILPCCSLLCGRQAVVLSDRSIVRRGPEVARPYSITLV